MDNLWMIDLQNFDDLDYQPEDQERSCDWKLLQTKGQQNPGAISHHSSVVYGDRMYLYGGSKSNGEEPNQLYCLLIEKLQWAVVKNVSILK